jgi:hypothetical protein
MSKREIKNIIDNESLRWSKEVKKSKQECLIANEIADSANERSKLLFSAINQCVELLKKVGFPTQTERDVYKILEQHTSKALAIKTINQIRNGNEKH